jgi:HK97 gp10 family phage protein
MADVLLKGTNKVAKELAKLPEKVRGRRLDNATRAAAKLVVDRAKNTYAPIETGKLREAIVTRKDAAESNPERSRYSVGYLWKIAPYGGYVEKGTRHTGAQPFLRPALETEAEHAIQTIASHLKKALKL